MNKLLLYSATCIGCTVLSCPIRIENDTQNPVIIVDPHGTTALYLQSENSQIIDPSLSPAWYYFPLYYFKKETLYIYTYNETHLFKLTYILTEQYCAPGEEHMSVTEIEELISNPTKRFTVTRVKKADKEHTH